MRSLFPAEPKIDSFLTDLVVNGNVAAATQNQAMNALVFLYKRVLNHALEGRINALRADKKITVPAFMTRGLKIVPRVRARSPQATRC